MTNAPGYPHYPQTFSPSLSQSHFQNILLEFCTLVINLQIMTKNTLQALDFFSHFHIQNKLPFAVKNNLFL